MISGIGLKELLKHIILKTSFEDYMFKVRVKYDEVDNCY